MRGRSGRRRNSAPHPAAQAELHLHLARLAPADQPPRCAGRAGPSPLRLMRSCTTPSWAGAAAPRRRRRHHGSGGGGLAAGRALVRGATRDPGRAAGAAQAGARRRDPEARAYARPPEQRPGMRPAAHAAAGPLLPAGRSRAKVPRLAAAPPASRCRAIASRTVGLERALGSAARSAPLQPRGCGEPQRGRPPAADIPRPSRHLHGFCRMRARQRHPGQHGEGRQPPRRRRRGVGSQPPSPQAADALRAPRRGGACGRRSPPRPGRREQHLPPRLAAHSRPGLRGRPAAWAFRAQASRPRQRAAARPGPPSAAPPRRRSAARAAPCRPGRGGAAPSPPRPVLTMPARDQRGAPASSRSDSPPAGRRTRLRRRRRPPPWQREFRHGGTALMRLVRRAARRARAPRRGASLAIL